MRSCSECERPVADAAPVTIGGVTFAPSVLCYCAVHGSFSLAVACHLAKHGPPSGAGLEHMRRALGVDGKVLAGRLGVGAPTISKWENGRQAVDRFAWLAVGSLVLEAAGATASMSSRLEALGRSEPAGGPVMLEDVKQPAREVVAVEHQQRRRIVEAVRKVYDRIAAWHRWSKQLEARLERAERQAEKKRRLTIKAGTPIADPNYEPHLSDDVEPPLEVTRETWDLWHELREIDPRFDDPEMIERVLHTGRKDAKGAPKTAARIAWEARIEDADRADRVRWRDVEAKIAGRYYRALQGS